VKTADAVGREKGKRVAVGVDIGSLTAKSVVVDQDRRIVSYYVVQGMIVDEEAAVQSLEFALRDAGLGREAIGFLVTTGYGRTRGARYLLPSVRTVIDIGGQDSKAIALDPEGRVANFSMNDKCAAGTGRFLEVMAQALNVELSKMGELALASAAPPLISSMCTVFAESEVISLRAKGCATPDIVAGIHEAIGRRMTALVNHVGLREPVLMSGGVAKNQGVVRVLERLLGVKITVPEEPQIVGALGAALFALDELGKKRG